MLAFRGANRAFEATATKTRREGGTGCPRGRAGLAAGASPCETPAWCGSRLQAGYPAVFGSSVVVGRACAADSKFFALMEPLEPLGSHSYVESASGRVVAAPGSVLEDTFGAFYRREYDRAVRLAWLLTGSRPVAEDVAQDAMAAVYRVFERIESPNAYLRRAVVNTARSWHRDERRHQERSTLLARERHTVDARDAELLDAIARLPYRQRVVIVARYWGGWSEAEIAQSLGCRPGTVKSLASRGLNRLRREVQQ